MCRLFGMSGGAEPARATFWLLDAPDSLLRQSHHNPDGTGLGYFDATNTPVVDKQPIAAWSDAAFAHEAREVLSPTIVAHIRFASNGGPTPQNTHPFEQEGRLFAHNGVIGDTARLDAALGDARRLVHGDTDSERYFALVTQSIHRHGGDVAQGFAEAARWIASELPVYSLNAVLITPHQLLALRYPDTHELHVLERRAGTSLQHRSSLGTRVSSPHAADHDLVVVASERLDADPGWRLLEPGELISVGELATVRSTLALPDPPTHRISVAELDAHARASQEPPAPH